VEFQGRILFVIAPISEIKSLGQKETSSSPGKRDGRSDVEIGQSPRVSSIIFFLIVKSFPLCGFLVSNPPTLSDHLSNGRFYYSVVTRREFVGSLGIDHSEWRYSFPIHILSIAENFRAVSFRRSGREVGDEFSHRGFSLQTYHMARNRGLESRF
jgi:hypothetical protein